MKHETQSPESAPTIISGKAEIMRRLANAISEVTRKPDTVRMNSIWSCIECEAHRKQLKPEDLKKYELEERKLENATARRKELKAAFDAARLCLQEDEAVFLSQTIRCLPDICADAWTHIDYVDDEIINKMSEIASRLQFRADTELHNKEREAGGGTGAASSPRDLELLAQTQRTLGSGILVDGEGTSGMSEEDKLLFNLLREGSPNREGWALSYREIGSRLNISHSQVQKKREGFEKNFPAFCGLIAEARKKSDKGKVHPDLCTSGRKIITNDPPENPDYLD